MVQFSLLSLIPGLLRALQDCSDPELNAYEQNLVKPTSVRTSDKKSRMRTSLAISAKHADIIYSSCFHGVAIADFWKGPCP